MYVRHWYGLIAFFSSYSPPNVVKLNANRTVVGTLRGFDQFMNLVVESTVAVDGDENTDIGTVVRFSIPSSYLLQNHKKNLLRAVVVI